ncbi:hypothetical protein O6H91_01G078000 [Diphasiastrum complanatum]|nr:hypothetical protein O6H91_01G078000 [Diphasiastrum complanatum]
MSISADASDATASTEGSIDEQKWSSARVLGYATEEFPWWDRKLLSGAVVVRENGLQGPYRMYYYGRGSDVWNMGVKPFNQFLPTGRVGLATSSDGLSFLRYKGDLEGGAIMDPSDNPTDFDCVHVAVSDVHYQKEDKLWLMHYFGGGLDEAVLAGFSELPIKGIKLRPGVATSADGLHFQSRNGPILDVGDAGSWDQNGVSWPRVLLPSETSVPGVLQGKWVMTYHTRELGVGPGGAGYFSAGLAISEDGKTWEKQGKIISAGSSGSWDENGVSVRHVVMIGSQYVMFYEGSNYKGEFAIGLAVSDDGIAWRKDEEFGSEPGGPILRARKGEDVWDNVIVATPYVLPMQDGSFRMYYLGVGRRPGEETKQGIGLAVSKGSDFRTWTRIV